MHIVEYGKLSRRHFLGNNTILLAGLAGPLAVRAQDGTASIDSIKNSLVRISDEGLVGQGFILEMEDVSYIVTNASIISGHDRFEFQNLNGKSIRPLSIEISATRDLARFKVSGEPGLKLVSDLPENANVSVIEFGSSSNVCSHSGAITGGSKDMIELSAAVGEECRGSPMLTGDMAAGGVATHLIYFKPNGEGWSGTPRHFAYRLDDASWYAPNWKAYNRTYGKNLRDIDEFRTILYQIADQWLRNPKKAIETDADLGLEFDRWLKQHNGMVTDLSGKVAKGGRDAANASAKKDFEDSCQMLYDLCDSKAKSLEFICNDRNITPYLQMQFKWRSLELLKFCHHIDEHRKKLAKTSWR